MPCIGGSGGGGAGAPFSGRDGEGGGPLEGGGIDCGYPYKGISSCDDDDDDDDGAPSGSDMGSGGGGGTLDGGSGGCGDASK